MDEDACYHFLLDLFHPEGLRCPRCRAPDGFLIHRYYRAPVLDYRCRVWGRIFKAWTGTMPQGTHYHPAKIVLIEEHSITVGSSGDPRGHRKCLPLKEVPASRLVIRTQQQDGFRTLLVPVEARPLQSQVHYTADRTLDRTTSDRHL